MKRVSLFLAVAVLCSAALVTRVALAASDVAPGTGFNLDGQGTGIYDTRPTGADVAAGSVVLQIVTHASDGTAIDLDLDGNREVVVQTNSASASATQTRLYIFEAQGNNDFRQRSTVLIDQGTNNFGFGLFRGVDVGNVDGDPDLEIVAASGIAQDSFLTIYDVDSTFAMTELVQTQIFSVSGGLFTTSGTINQVRILPNKNGGINNDILISENTGIVPHLFAVEYNGTAIVFVNTTAANSGISVNNGVIGFDHGNFGDASDEEIVMATETPSNALVIREYVTSTTAPFGAAKTITTNWTGASSGSTTTVAVADLDGDGDLDAAVNDVNANFVRGVRRTGVDTYTTEAIFATALTSNPSAVEISDFDNDGRREVVYSNGTSVVFREHDGTADSFASGNFGAEGNLLTGLGTGTADAISFVGGSSTTLDEDLNFDFVIGRSVNVTDTDMDSDEAFFLEADRTFAGPIPAGSYDNLEITGSSSLSGATTVNGILALTSGDLDTGVFTLTMPASASSTGTTDVVGNVRRTGFLGGPSRSFGNPYNLIQIDSGTAPLAITVNLVKAAPGTFAGAVTRTYTITTTGGIGYSATLQLHYLDSELNGNTEAALNLWRENSGTWNNQGGASHDSTNNWVRQTGVTQFSQWTLANGSPTAANGSISGTIADVMGQPVAGTIVSLTGSQNRKTITNASGYYQFDKVEASGFYTVTPARANYSFIPSNKSFSLIGNHTEAAFTGSSSGDNSSPIDTPEYFVRQHYLDFLGREPDEAGFNFWSDQILECGADANCIERRRENVSAAYFLSIEFQRTGGLVDRLYRASYGVRPQFSEFMADSVTIARGVVVGRTGWAQLLEANEEAFFADWLERPAFRAVYDALTNDRYVDSLIAHTGVGFTPSERDALVSDLNSGNLTRAGVLQRIAEDERFVAAKRNESFVMMQYFGYLQRDPDDSGFQFWLNKLNQFGGNFEAAEMVKAFIVSGEYRDRFPR